MHTAKSPDRLTSTGIVLGVSLASAVLLRYFLLAESWITVLVLLACFAVGLIAVQKRPALEERIVDAFSQCRTLSVTLGIVLALVFNWVIDGDSYAMH